MDELKQYLYALYIDHRGTVDYNIISLAFVSFPGKAHNAVLKKELRASQLSKNKFGSQLQLSFFLLFP